MPTEDKTYSGKTAYLVGATGLIGSHLLRLLLESPYYSRVIVQARSQCPAEYSLLCSSGRLVWLDFESVLPNNVNDYFCALGTTQKLSGKDGLVKVDRDLVVQTASIALRAGASLFSVVSALGASESSKFHYNRTKGQMETALEKLNPSTIHFWQPSLLLGDRADTRFGESLGAMFLDLSLLGKPLWGNLGAREGATVAKAMINAAQVAKTRHIRYKVRSIDTFSKLTD